MMVDNHTPLHGFIAKFVKSKFPTEDFPVSERITENCFFRQALAKDKA